MFYKLYIFPLALCCAATSYSAELTFSGYDMHGKQRSCPAKDLATMICDMRYGPEEVFQSQCQNMGFKAYICGCHDYLCSSKIIKKKLPPKQAPEPLK